MLSRAASEPLMPSQAPLMPTYVKKKIFFEKKNFEKKVFEKKNFEKKNFEKIFFLKYASIYLHAGI